MSQLTAEAVYQQLRKLPSDERAKFFQLLGGNTLDDQDQSHEQVFGHLAGAEFTTAQAAEYLEMSISTFRRHVQAQRIKSCGQIGRSEMYATKDLKTFKRALREVKGA